MDKSPAKVEIEYSKRKPVCGLKELIIDGVNKPVKEISPGTYEVNYK